MTPAEWARVFRAGSDGITAARSHLTGLTEAEAVQAALTAMAREAEMIAGNTP